MTGFWKTRIVKHRLYTGDISNHIHVGAIELVDSEPELGLYVFEVHVTFIPGDDEDYYVYEVEVDNPELSEAEALELVIEQIGV